jgi:hypothetical protein
MIRRIVCLSPVFLSLLTAAPATKGRVVVLFDLSQSAQDVRNEYLSEFEKVAGQLRGGDSIVAAAISSNSLSSGRFDLNIEVPTYSPFSDSRLTYATRLKKVQASIHEAARGILKEPATAQTDLLGAMQLAAKALAVNSAGARFLVVFSDMIEESPQLNFRALRLTDARIASILAVERKNGRIPSLSGVRVWVAGAGGASRDKFLEIQNFWIRYFQAAGAELAPAHYNASLLDFTLPQ